MVTSTNETSTGNTSQELDLPLFHQPLVIEGKRVRKLVARFDSCPRVAPQPQQDHNAASAGNGIALNHIKAVKQELVILEASKLKLMHKALFGSLGKQSSSKLVLKIGQFKGFPFTTDSREYEKRKTLLSKMLDVDLEIISKILGLTAGVTTNQTISNIMDFLMTPKHETVGQKRRNISDNSESPKKKHPRKAGSSSCFRLSESSDSDGENPDNELAFSLSVVKPKKQVTFVDMVLQEQHNENAGLQRVTNKL